MTAEASGPPTAALQAAFEQVAEAVFVTSPSGAILFANPGFEEVTGYTPKEVIGRTPNLLKSGEHDRAFYDHLWSTIKEGDVWRGSVVNRRKDGTHYEAEASITPVRDAQGEVTYFVAVQRDVTRLRQTQKLEALGMVTASIAHELNNPLSFLLVNLEVIREVWEDAAPLLAERLADDPQARLARLPWAEVEETVPKLLAGMKGGAERVQRMTQELRTFTREERRASPHPFHLEEALQGALELLGPKLGDKGVGVEVDCPNELPAVQGWPGELEQVLVNLVHNGIEVVPDEGGRIRICARCEGDQVVIRVQDNGPGVPKEIRHRVFEPFFSTCESGTGLGLAISRRIVGRMQGDLRLVTTDDDGACFEVRLPISEAADAD